MSVNAMDAGQGLADEILSKYESIKKNGQGGLKIGDYKIEISMAPKKGILGFLFGKKEKSFVILKKIEDGDTEVSSKTIFKNRDDLRSIAEGAIEKFQGKQLSEWTENRSTLFSTIIDPNSTREAKDKAGEQLAVIYNSPKTPSDIKNEIKSEILKISQDAIINVAAFQLGVSKEILLSAKEQIEASTGGTVQLFEIETLNAAAGVIKYRPGGPIMQPGTNVTDFEMAKTLGLELDPQTGKILSDREKCLVASFPGFKFKKITIQHGDEKTEAYYGTSQNKENLEPPKLFIDTSLEKTFDLKLFQTKQEQGTSNEIRKLKTKVESMCDSSRLNEAPKSLESDQSINSSEISPQLKKVQKSLESDQSINFSEMIQELKKVVDMCDSSQLNVVQKILESAQSINFSEMIQKLTKIVESMSDSQLNEAQKILESAQSINFSGMENIFNKNDFSSTLVQKGGNSFSQRIQDAKKSIKNIIEQSMQKDNPESLTPQDKVTIEKGWEIATGEEKGFEEIEAEIQKDARIASVNTDEKAKTELTRIYLGIPDSIKKQNNTISGKFDALRKNDALTEEHRLLFTVLEQQYGPEKLKKLQTEAVQEYVQGYHLRYLAPNL